MSGVAIGGGIIIVCLSVFGYFYYRTWWPPMSSVLSSFAGIIYIDSGIRHDPLETLLGSAVMVWFAIYHVPHSLRRPRNGKPQ